MLSTYFPKAKCFKIQGNLERGLFSNFLRQHFSVTSPHAALPAMKRLVYLLKPRTPDFTETWGRSSATGELSNKPTLKEGLRTPLSQSGWKLDWSREAEGALAPAGWCEESPQLAPDTPASGAHGRARPVDGPFFLLGVDPVPTIPTWPPPRQPDRQGEACRH